MLLSFHIRKVLVYEPPRQSRNAMHATQYLLMLSTPRLHTHILHTRVMHGHALHADIVSCTFERIHSVMPTASTGTMLVFQRFRGVNSFISGGTLTTSIDTKAL